MISSRSLLRPCRGAGLTLVELSVAVATGAILVVTVGSVLLTSTRAADVIMKESSARKVEVTLRRITENLRRSGNSRVTIGADPSLNSILTLQVLSSADGVSWGAERIDGTFVDGWSTSYRRSGSDLVQQTLDDAGAVVEQLVVAVGVQDPGGGGRGFDVRVVNSVYEVTINVTRTLGTAASLELSLGASVFVRN